MDCNPLKLISQLPALYEAKGLLPTFVTSLTPNHPNPAMEQNLPNYIYGHYAAQNREEMGAAISKHVRDLDATDFGEMLNVYDKIWDGFSPISVPKPVPKPLEMIKKLEARKAQEKATEKEKALEEGRSECCDFLNTLLPSMQYALR